MTKKLTYHDLIAAVQAWLQAEGFAAETPVPLWQRGILRGFYFDEKPTGQFAFIAETVTLEIRFLQDGMPLSLDEPCKLPCAVSLDVAHLYRYATRTARERSSIYKTGMALRLDGDRIQFPRQ